MATLPSRDPIPAALDNRLYNINAAGDTEGEVTVEELLALAAAKPGLYRNIWAGAGVMIPQFVGGGTPGTYATPTFAVMHDFIDFAPGVDTYAQFSMMMPDEWDLGELKFKFYWKAGLTPGAGDVVWNVSPQAITPGTVVDFPYPAGATIVDTYLLNSRFLHTTTALGSSVNNTPNIEDSIYFRVGRVGTAGADTYTEDARLLGIAIQYKEGITIPVVW